MNISNEEELGKAMRDNVSELIIEGDLKNKVLKIKSINKTAWLIVMGAIGTSVTAILATPVTAGISNISSFLTVPTAIGILGASTTTSAIKIAVAAKSIKVLEELRNYNIVEKNDIKLILKTND